MSLATARKDWHVLPWSITSHLFNGMSHERFYVTVSLLVCPALWRVTCTWCNASHLCCQISLHQMQPHTVGAGLCHHTRPFATIVEGTVYVKAFSIRMSCCLEALTMQYTDSTRAWAKREGKLLEKHQRSWEAGAEAQGCGWSRPVPGQTFERVGGNLGIGIWKYREGTLVVFDLKTDHFINSAWKIDDRE